MPSYNRKPPLVAAHDLPVEAPSGPAPRNPLRSLLLGLAVLFGVLFLLDAFVWDPSTPVDPLAFETAVESVTCPGESPGRLRCYVGSATNVSEAAAQAGCSWEPVEPPQRWVVRGGELPTGPIQPGETIRSDVVRIPAATEPRLVCRGLGIP